MSNHYICINNFTWVYSMYWEKFTLKGPLIYELYVKQFHFWKDFHAIGNFLQKQNWFSHQKLMMRSTNFQCSKFWQKVTIWIKLTKFLMLYNHKLILQYFPQFLELCATPPTLHYLLPCNHLGVISTVKCTPSKKCQFSGGFGQ